MAKDLVSSLGAGELSALLSMQVQRLQETTQSIVSLFEQNDRLVFSHAYNHGDDSPEFVAESDKMFNELDGVVDTIEKIRAAQKSLRARE